MDEPRRSHRFLKSERGFTLTEIIIAVTLFGLLAAGLFSAFVSASHWVQPTSNNQNTAAYVAAGELEKLYPAVREDWWEGAGAAGKPLTVGVPGGISVTLDGVTYTSQNAVSAVSGGPDYRKVVETVSWT